MKIFRSILFVLLWLGTAAAEVFAAARLWKLDMLPLNFKLIGCMALITLWLLAGLLFLSGSKAKSGKHPGLFRRIVAWLLSLVLAGGCLYSTRVADQLDETISKVTEDVKVSTVIGVYVMEDDPAQTLRDAADYTFGMTEIYDAANVRYALADLRETLGTVKTEPLPTVSDMVHALYDGDVGAVILNEAYLSVLEETEGCETFPEDTRVIYEIPVEEGAAMVPVGTPAPENGEDSDVEVGAYDAIECFQPVNVTQEPFVVYLSGSDTRSRMLATSRSDVNILLVVNPLSKQILLLNTPRDYYVPNPAGGGAMDKLTHCGIYGIGCSAGALANLYRVPVNYYAQINFTGFETLIDAIGGVTVYSEYTFNGADGTPFTRGENDLNGQQALDFVRERHSFASGDRQRGQNQMIVLSAVIQKLSKGTIILHHSQILDSLQGMFITNMSASEINDLVRMQLSDGAQWNVKTFAVTGGDGSNFTYSMPNMRAYVMYQDAGLVQRSTELVRKVLNGDTLTDADVT